ncbi:hypothetical protein GCM10023198_46220 [Promicromonospora umidemergens]|uniref:Uncharacterized protein n=1 Tax=Promicromonospora umidemergens TaxID=629679 RepID=A0ABP8XYN7_9MICO
MSAKRGDRAAPPPHLGGYTIRFATNDAAKGWEDLCRQAPSNVRTAFDAIESTPRPNPPTSRQRLLDQVREHEPSEADGLTARSGPALGTGGSHA